MDKIQEQNIQQYCNYSEGDFWFLPHRRDMLH